MNLMHKLDEIADQDPGFVRSVKRLRTASWIFGVALGVALAVAIFSLTLGLHNETRITKNETRVTKVEKSACAEAQEHPHDVKAIAECQSVRASAERLANKIVNCIPFWRAGYRCPLPGSPLAEEVAVAATEAATGARETTPPSRAPSASGGGDATTSPYTGSSQGGPTGSGGESEVAPGGHGHKKSPEKLSPTTGGEGGGTSVPGSSTSESSSQSSSSTTTERVESTVETPASEAAPVLEGVGKAAEGLGETVGGTVGHVEATTCSLAKVLC